MIHWCQVCHYSWYFFPDGRMWPDKKPLCRHPKRRMIPYVR